MEAADQEKNPPPQQNVPFFRARGRRPTALKEKATVKSSSSSSSGESSGGDEPVVSGGVGSSGLSLVNKRRQMRGRNLIQTTSKKKRSDLAALAESSSDDEIEADEQPDAEGVIARPTGGLDVKYASTGTDQRTGPQDMGATARTEIDTEWGRDAQAQFERVQALVKQDNARYAQIAADLKEGKEVKLPEKKIYRGLAVYGAKEKEDTAKGNASAGLNRKGPIRGTQFMRASVRWDYAPDICKDYKETGYCTFGDSCKFMHDRTDYKHGWEIDRDFEEGKMKEAAADEFVISSEDEDEAGDGLPFSCFICRDGFRNPVVTKCKHYFCESCALEQHRKNKRCACCNQKTDGMFNVARNIIAKMRATGRDRDGGGESSGAAYGETPSEAVPPKKNKREQREQDDEEIDGVSAVTMELPKAEGYGETGHNEEDESEKGSEGEEDGEEVDDLEKILEGDD